MRPPFLKSVEAKLKAHPRLVFLASFIVTWLIASFVFFLRFPNNFYEPNFYAEDGSIFLNNIEQHGFIGAFFTPFNGYFIFGLYLLEGFGYILNFILFHGQFVDLARSFAVTSYLFMGLICALPFLLFKNYFNLLAIFLIIVLSVFVPIPGSDYAIIGTIGNLKFIFVYLAFLLLAYRHLLPDNALKRFIAVDIILAICAYTNVVVYLLLPFALIRYIPLLRKKKFKKTFTSQSFKSLVALGFLLLPQLVMIKLFGIPAMPGYLDSPYKPESTAIMFIFRSYLFPLLWPAIKFTSDIAVVALFLGLSAGLWFSLKRYRVLYIFGYLTIFFTTLLFVINRPGVGEFFLTYAGSGPDQFFYTQNLIMCFLIGLAVSYLIHLIRNAAVRKLTIGLVILGIITLYAPFAGTYGKNDFMQRTVGNIYTTAKEACATNTKYPDLQMYPIVSDTFHIRDVDREKICTPDVMSYVPDTDYLAIEAKSENLIPDVSKARMTQTFRADNNGLSGVSLLFLTYQHAVVDRYRFTIFSKDCKKELRQIEINPGSIHDAEFTRINFERIGDSKGKEYCLSLTLSSNETIALALPLSQDNQYPQGQLLLDGAARNDDLVMRLHYAK